MPTALEHRLHVTGMDCPSCAAKIVATVTRFGDVSKINVDLAAQQLTFQTPDNVVDPNAVAEAVRKLGYGVQWVSPQA